MIEQLRIKCPSCGIILEVKNSKHEAVKRIVCPNCKKQLAIDFQEEPKPVKNVKPLNLLFHYNKQIGLQEGINRLPLPDCDYLEINVARISDGSNKCVVGSLSANHPVKINGTSLAFGDKVVLAIGDKVEIGKTILGYGCPVKEPSDEPAPQPKEGPAIKEPSKPSEPKKGHLHWLVIISVLIVSFLMAFFFLPSNNATDNDNAIATSDSAIKVKESKPVTVKKQEEPKPKSSSRQEKSSNSKSAGNKLTDLNDYELEKLAMNGEAKAQYELGKRWVNKHDSINIVKGINYLKLAARNGSDEAKKALNNVIQALEREAAHGNSTAENILREQ